MSHQGWKLIRDNLISSHFIVLFPVSLLKWIKNCIKIELYKKNHGFNYVTSTNAAFKSLEIFFERN